MSEPTDPSDLVAASVESLLDRLYAEARAVPADRRHEFAFNVLLNALFSVLEAIRAEAPERHAAYLTMSLTMLGDD